MRHYSCLMLLLFCLCCRNVTAQQTAGPVITFDKTELDFGEVNYGPDIVLDFWFQNTGDKPLFIENVKSSGGGSMVEFWPKEPILSNERAYIRVAYYGRRVGPTVKTFTVNCSGIEPVVLKIRGKIKEPPTEGESVGEPSGN